MSVTVQFIRRGDVMEGPASDRHVKVVRQERMDVVPRVGDHLLLPQSSGPTVVGEVRSLWWRSPELVQVAFD